MRILFLTSPSADYLADGLLHGLRRFFGPSVVDYPKADILYAGCSTEMLAQVRGKGFTLYATLQDESIDRYDIFEKIRTRYFNLVIFGSIWRQFGLYAQLHPWLEPGSTIVIDGEDSPAPYPASGFFWRRPYYWSLPRAHHHHLYFKRELTTDTRFTLVGARLVPQAIRQIWPQQPNLRPIAFSIPSEKILDRPCAKTKNFPTHVVDEEVSAALGQGQAQYAFAREIDYYRDLRSSRFGITTKRAGWDCLRHYEIAANGAVPAFRDLATKPSMCAPHGLDDTNCLSYTSASDLLRKIDRLHESDYSRLQAGAMAWARKQTTVARAQELIDAWRQSAQG